MSSYIEMAELLFGFAICFRASYTDERHSKGAWIGPTEDRR